MVNWRMTESFCWLGSSIRRLWAPSTTSTRARGLGGQGAHHRPPHPIPHLPGRPAAQGTAPSVTLPQTRAGPPQTRGRATAPNLGQVHHPRHRAGPTLDWEQGHHPQTRNRAPPRLGAGLPPPDPRQGHPPDQGRAPPDPGQGPPAHAQVLQAVGRGQHESGVDQGAPAEVGAYHLQRRHVGPRVRLGFPAAHDLGRLHRAWGQWRQRPSLPPAPGGPLWASPVLQMGKLRQSPSAPPCSLPPLRAFSPRMSCPGPTSVSPSAPGGRWAGVVGGHPPEPAACGQTDGRTHGPLTSQQRGQQG